MNKSLKLVLLTLLFILTACSSDGDTFTPNVPSNKDFAHKSDKRTVLVYMVANNNLSGFAEDNIDGMVEGMSGLDRVELSNCNLLFFISSGKRIQQSVFDGYYIDADGKKKTKYKTVYTYETPHLIKLDVDEDGKVGEYIVEKYADRSPVDPLLMQTVMNDAFNGQFKAQSNLVILWSHADGWLPADKTFIGTTRWFGQDGNLFMDLLQLKAGFSTMPKLDALLSDCCFMQNIEVAYELRDNATYFVGSPAEIPGPGAPYAKLVKDFFNDNTVGRPKEFSIDMANTYYNHYADDYRGSGSYGSAMSIIDGEELDYFAATTKRLLEENKNSLSSYNVTSDVIVFDERSSSYYYDMKQIMNNYFRKIPYVYSEWEAAFEKAVPFAKSTKTIVSVYPSNKYITTQGMSGMAVYSETPSNSTSFVLDYYKRISWYKDVAYLLDK